MVWRSGGGVVEWWGGVAAQVGDSVGVLVGVLFGVLFGVAYGVSCVVVVGVSVLASVG